MQFEPSRETQSPAYPVSGHPPTPPPAGWPQMYGPPPKLRAPNWKLFGIILGGVLGGIALLFTLLAIMPSAADDVEVHITSCENNGLAATAGYVATNRGDSTTTVTISVEYQNYLGEKVDDDVETSQDIAPGQTLRGEVTTFLDAEMGNKGQCVLTGVS